MGSKTSDSAPGIGFGPGARSAGVGRHRTTGAWLELAGGERLPIDSSCSLGRCPSNHVVLRDEKISRKHALIHLKTETDYWLSDLGSSNGTYLNGRRLEKAARLYERDEISIGPHRLTFRQPKGLHRAAAEATITEPTICEPCGDRAWLLLVQLDSPSRVARSVPQDRVPAIVEHWQEQCQALVESHGGLLNRYLANGFLAFWRDRRTAVRGIAAALVGLQQLHSRAEPPFRFILHLGPVTFSEAEADQGEEVSGASVAFLLRVQRLAGAGQFGLISEEAGRVLQHDFPLTGSTQCSLETAEGEPHSFFRI